MTESRMELLNWLNTTLDLNYTKVEQLGSGAAYCQIMDSIFLDVNMNRVKFDATKEYEYLNNFKVLQSCFVKHKINKTIPVERLVKCKFQDNLEFFQWMRKFWKENKDETDYDPNARRKAMPPSMASTPATTATPLARSRGSTTSTGAHTSSSRRSISSSSTGSGASGNLLPRTRTAAPGLMNGLPSRTGSRVSSLSNGINHERESELKETRAELEETRLELQDTREELQEYRSSLDALDTERNFYFNKLREIEILVQTTDDLLKQPPLEGEKHPTLEEILTKIQGVLYYTEEGFQIPDDAMQEDTIQEDVNLEETF